MKEMKKGLHVLNIWLLTHLLIMTILVIAFSAWETSPLDDEDFAIICIISMYGFVTSIPSLIAGIFFFKWLCRQLYNYWWLLLAWFGFLCFVGSMNLSAALIIIVTGSGMGTSMFNWLMFLSIFLSVLIRTPQFIRIYKFSHLKSDPQ